MRRFLKLKINGLSLEGCITWFRYKLISERYSLKYSLIRLQSEAFQRHSGRKVVEMREKLTHKWANRLSASSAMPDSESDAERPKSVMEESSLKVNCLWMEGWRKYIIKSIRDRDVFYVWPAPDPFPVCAHRHTLTHPPAQEESFELQRKGAVPAGHISAHVLCIMK